MNTFVLHGTFGSPFDNWFGWLNKQLSESGVACYNPYLPTPLGQDFDNWSRIIDSYFDAGLLGPQSVVIGHSSSAVFWVKYLASKKVSVKTLVTVSGFNSFISGLEDFDKLNSNLYVSDDEAEQFLKLEIPTVCFVSENDPYLPLEELNSFSKLIKGDTVVVKDGGHFNTDSGYDSFDAVYELIVDLKKA
ncbi:YdeN-like protein [Vibrio nigripulchritudo ATCC 27043]|nr:YdeN-like protein [Vibrio nigripulchritudo ATCC 27043]